MGRSLLIPILLVSLFSSGCIDPAAAKQNTVASGPAADLSGRSSESQHSGKSAILGYRIVKETPRQVEVAVDYQYGGSLETVSPYLVVRAYSDGAKYKRPIYTSPPVTVTGNKGTAHLVIERVGGMIEPIETDGIEVVLFANTKELAKSRFAQHIPWHLKGANQILGCRVVSVSDTRLTLEVEYYYNDDRSRSPVIRARIEGKSSYGDSFQAEETSSTLEPGKHKVTIKLFRPVSPNAGAAVDAIVAKMYDLNGMTLAQQTFHEQAQWEAIDPLFSDGKGRADMETLTKRVDSYIDSGKRGRLRDAKTILDKLLLDNPKYVAGYTQLARYYLKKNPNPQGLSQAERVLHSALAIDPAHTDSLVLLGYVYSHQKKYKLAGETFKKAQARAADDARLHVYWGEMLLTQGKTKAAIRQYQDALQGDRKFDAADRGREAAYRTLVTLYLGKGSTSMADRTFKAMVAEFEDKPCLLGEYGAFQLSALGAVDGAIDSARNAADRGCGDKANLSRTLGAAYFAQWANRLEHPHGGARDNADDLYNKGQTLFNEIAELYLYMASSPRTAHVIPHLKKKGLDINATNVDGLSALVLAIQNGNQKAVDRLLDNGADPNRAVGAEGVSPLMVAVMVGNEGIVTRLLAAGADSKAQSKSGASPVDLARRLGNAAIVRLVSQAGL